MQELSLVILSIFAIAGIFASPIADVNREKRDGGAGIQQIGNVYGGSVLGIGGHGRFRRIRRDGGAGIADVGRVTGGVIVGVGGDGGPFGLSGPGIGVINGDVLVRQNLAGPGRPVVVAVGASKNGLDSIGDVSSGVYVGVGADEGGDHVSSVVISSAPVSTSTFTSSLPSGSTSAVSVSASTFPATSAAVELAPVAKSDSLTIPTTHIHIENGVDKSTTIRV